MEMLVIFKCVVLGYVNSVICITYEFVYVTFVIIVCNDDITINTNNYYFKMVAVKQKLIQYSIV